MGISRKLRASGSIIHAICKRDDEPNESEDNQPSLGIYQQQGIKGSRTTEKQSN